MVKQKESKDKALETAMNQIEKQFGRGAIMKLGMQAAQIKVDVISTGSISLDTALGIGGVPRGRIVEIFGPEASGKTTLSLHIVAEAQKAGGIAAFVDAEHALDPAYTRRIGVDLDNLLVSQPDTGEQALEIVQMVAAGMATNIWIEQFAELELAYPTYTAIVGLAARQLVQQLGVMPLTPQWRALVLTHTAEWEHSEP